MHCPLRLHTDNGLPDEHNGFGRGGRRWCVCVCVSQGCVCVDVVVGE